MWALPRSRHCASKSCRPGRRRPHREDAQLRTTSTGTSHASQSKVARNGSPDEAGVKAGLDTCANFPDIKRRAVSVLVSVATVRCRSSTLTLPLAQAASVVANHGGRTLADLQSGLGSRPRGFESRILRSPDQARCAAVPGSINSEDRSSLSWHLGVALAWAVDPPAGHRKMFPCGITRPRTSNSFVVGVGIEGGVPAPGLAAREAISSRW